ncbi:hypothetical protein D3C76_868970 [compost metagenome]
MGGSGRDATRAPRPKCQPQLAVEGEGLGRHPDDGGQIHHGIIGIIEVLLAAAFLHPVAKLHPPKAKGIGELLHGHILTSTHVLAHTWLIDISALERDCLALRQFGDQLILMLFPVGASISHFLKRRAQIEIVAAHLFADHPALACAMTVDIEADRLGLAGFGRQRLVLALEGIDGLLLGVTLGQHARPGPHGAGVTLALDRPNRLGWIVFHPPEQAVLAALQLEVGQAALVPHRLIQLGATYHAPSQVQF